MSSFKVSIVSVIVLILQIFDDEKGGGWGEVPPNPSATTDTTRLFNESVDLVLDANASDDFVVHCKN